MIRYWSRWLASVAVSGLVVASCTTGTDPSSTTLGSTSSTVTSSTLESTTTLTASSSSTTTVPEPDIRLDMAEVIASAELVSPVGVLTLGWGTGVGEVGERGIAGPHAIDVAPDGTIFIVDIINGRIQEFDGDAWSVFVDYGADSPRQPYGVAALDSGSVAVQVREPSGNTTTAFVEMFSADGAMIGSWQAPVISNHPFGGGASVWTGYGVGASPTVWMQLSDGVDLVEFTDDVLSTLALEWEEAVSKGDLNGTLDAAVAAGYGEVRDDGDVVLQVSQEFVSRTVVLPFEVAAGHDDRVLTLEIADTGSAPPSQWDISPDGVMFAAVPGGDEVVAVLCDYEARCVSLRTPREQWRETNTWDWARLVGRDLYLLQAGPHGARIEIYEM